MPVRGKFVPLPTGTEYRFCVDYFCSWPQCEERGVKVCNAGEGKFVVFCPEHLATYDRQRAQARSSSRPR